MADDMRQHGYDSRFPIMLYVGKILDGCNRSIAAGRAGVEPLFLTFVGTLEEAEQFCPAGE